MSFGTAITVLRLLYAFNARPHRSMHLVREAELELEGEAQPAKCFEPAGKPRHTLVLVHGVTGRANADPLIVHLGRCLAHLGFRCVVPGLRELARFRHDPRDLRTLVAALKAAYRLERRPVRVLAFSYGASYALAAAADPEARDACAALVGFGAYYSLAEALEYQCRLLERHPVVEQDDADIAYLRYTLLACHREQLELSAEAWAALEPILLNYTDREPLPIRLAPLLRYARDVDYVALMKSYQRRHLSPQLSPAVSLGNVRCSVGLLHDPADRFVPAEHVQRIRDALDQRPHATPTRVLETPMLSHVQVDPLKRIRDLPRLIDLLEPVLGTPHQGSALSARQNLE